MISRFYKPAFRSIIIFFGYIINEKEMCIRDRENSTEEVQPEEIIEEAEETEETAEPVELAAEAGVIDVSTKEELQAVLQNNSVNTINIIGSFTYDDAIDTAKKIVVKNGVTFGWNVYPVSYTHLLECTVQMCLMIWMRSPAVQNIRNWEKVKTENLNIISA